MVPKVNFLCQLGYVHRYVGVKVRTDHPIESHIAIALFMCVVVPIKPWPFSIEDMRQAL